jgi:hypothetical protein
MITYHVNKDSAEHFSADILRETEPVFFKVVNHGMIVQQVTKIDIDIIVEKGSKCFKKHPASRFYKLVYNFGKGTYQQAEQCINQDQ